MISVQNTPKILKSSWKIPAMDIHNYAEKKNRWCVVIPVINEGLRVKSLLSKMSANMISSIADIIICDGGSSDHSLELEMLQEYEVKTLIIKKGEGKLSAQLRCAYSYALDEGYDGIITIDGNDKDDPDAIPFFIEALQDGIDFVQASRFLPGGVAKNTPKSRNIAIRLIHAPMLSLASGFSWTDTTQGFRGYSSKLLLDENISIFRDVFSGYELLAYLSYIAPRLGYKCLEIPTKRIYPEGVIPTKISSLSGNFEVLRVLFNACLGNYNRRSNS